MIDTQMMEKGNSNNCHHRHQPLVFVGRQQIHTFADEPLAKRRKMIHSSSPSRSATMAVASGTHQQIHAMYASVQRHLDFKSSAVTASTAVNDRFLPIAMAVD